MNLRSIWMHPWDLEGADFAFLRDCGLNAINLAYVYHGGRMVLPRHPSRRVYEHASAAYYPVNRWHYGRLQPHETSFPMAPRPDLPVYAWTVLCHNDRLGEEHPDCCITNVYGDPYRYALCPSHPDVREYVVALCHDVASQPDIAGLDLEALSFLGYEHGGLHDKTGVPLPASVRRLLSVCACEHCKPADAPAIRHALDRFFETGEEPAIPLDGVAEQRRATLRSLLTEIRAAVGSMHLNVRLAPSLQFDGGKAQLDWTDLAGCADAATLTFFGAPVDRMTVPPDRHGVATCGGFVFHHPDCASEEDVRARLDALRAAGIDDFIFYCYGMADDRHFAWLRKALLQ